MLIKCKCLIPAVIRRGDTLIMNCDFFFVRLGVLMFDLGRKVTEGERKVSHRNAQIIVRHAYQLQSSQCHAKTTSTTNSEARQFSLSLNKQLNAQWNSSHNCRHGQSHACLTLISVSTLKTSTTNTEIMQIFLTYRHFISEL